MQEVAGYQKVCLGQVLTLCPAYTLNLQCVIQLLAATVSVTVPYASCTALVHTGYPRWGDRTPSGLDKR